MKIQGKFNCERCNSIINWEYIIPRYYTNPVVEMINKDLLHPSKDFKIKNDEYCLEFYCPSCGYRNVINHKL